MKNNRTIYKALKTRSFRSILIFSLVFISLTPILTLQYFSDNRISENLRENMDRLAMSNVTKTRDNLSIHLDAYNDLLYQIYTNDEIVRLIYEIDEGDNRVVGINQLRRTLRAMCYAKDGIESISIITSGGSPSNGQPPEKQLIYYDKLTASSVTSSWLGKEDLTKESVFEKGIGDYNTKLLPTMFVMNVGTTPTYEFHMLHRMIDYKNIDVALGVAIISLNETVLHNICNQDMLQGTFSFVIDRSGRIVSYPDKSRIGSQLELNYNPDDLPHAEEVYRGLLNTSGYLSKVVSIYHADMDNGWRVVSAVDQSSFYNEIALQKKNMLVLGILIITAAILLILVVTTLLSRSMNTVTAAMKQAQKGDLAVSVPENRAFSSEMIIIVKTFNNMMRRIADLVTEVKLATVKQKDFEIKALEAQINPHFLYNVLDSINWMAIDKDQFEISQMISALAKILRYSINNSNTEVSVRDEIDWLNQYIHLQQMRFKNSFDYTITSDEQLLDFRVHKLMLQPFVENAIVHGFKDSDRHNLLNISIRDAEDHIQINVHDNGCGITPEKLYAIHSENHNGSDHIGIANAIGRIRMYYGNRADVTVVSEQALGTTVTIRLAK